METYDPDSFQYGWNSYQSYLHTSTYFVPYSKHFQSYCSYYVKCHWLAVTLNLFVIFLDCQIKHISHNLISFIALSFLSALENVFRLSLLRVYLSKRFSDYIKSDAAITVFLLTFQTPWIFLPW